MRPTPQLLAFLEDLGEAFGRGVLKGLTAPAAEVPKPVRRAVRRPRVPKSPVVQAKPPIIRKRNRILEAFPSLRQAGP